MTDTNRSNEHPITLQMVATDVSVDASEDRSVAEARLKLQLAALQLKVAEVTAALAKLTGK